MKLCTTCGINKELDAFHNYAKGPGGKAYRCKVCDNAARKAYHERHPERTRQSHRKANLLNKYGLTVESYDAMWEHQAGQCKICSTEMVNIRIDGESRNKSNTACVDHCHTTGRVRGLLCTTCNKALGLFKDDAQRLRTAAAYLETIH